MARDPSALRADLTRQDSPADPPVQATFLPPSAKHRPAAPPATGANGVPQLEPPARVSARISSAAERRAWQMERVREVPSWMTSAAVHLAAFICFASLVGPAQKLHRHPFQIVELSATFTLAPDQEDSSEQPTPVKIEASPTEAEDDTHAEQRPEEQVVGMESAGKPEEEPPEVAQEPVSEPDKAGEDAAGKAGPTAEELLAMESAIPTPLTSSTTGRLDAFTNAATLPADLAAGIREKLEPSTEIPEWDRTDAVVDRFIQYDIGRLPGPAGQQANREFNQLGPESIPALVRGLNKSASIRASCPVGVISRKLETAMQQTQNQQLVNHALDNLGKDVPSNAPHFQRINRLRERLMVTANREFARTLAENGIKTSGNTDWLVELYRFSRADLNQVSLGLQSRKPTTRLAAVTALSLRSGSELTSSQNKALLAHLLLSQFRRVDRNTRSRMQSSLESLAHDVAASRRTPAYISQQPLTVLREWRLWWSDADPDTVATGNDLLELANSSRSSQFAQELRRELAEGLPRTPAGAQGFRLLTAEGKLGAAWEMEQGRIPELAIPYYSELVRMHPRSSSASKARSRLRRLANNRGA